MLCLLPHLSLVYPLIHQLCQLRHVMPCINHRHWRRCSSLQYVCNIDLHLHTYICMYTRIHTYIHMYNIHTYIHYTHTDRQRQKSNYEEIAFVFWTCIALPSDVEIPSFVFWKPLDPVHHEHVCIFRCRMINPLFVQLLLILYLTANDRELVLITYQFGGHQYQEDS